ncbi:TPA: hypothetical protein I3322_001753, partial [Enterobacter hormaechei subsp. xiangfangensis]|nr:hypothetical protein [Enterobacter hormaechei subsp. xiangfangensis]
LKLNNKEIQQRTNVFFEDKENYDFFTAIVTRRDINKLLNLHKDVTLGCENYFQLLKKKVPGFYKSAVIVLDGDVKNKGYENVVTLPTDLPPDQLIFEYLYNLDASDYFWKNDLRYTKTYFHEVADKIIMALNLTEENIVLKNKIPAKNKQVLNGVRLRDLFKSFVLEQTFQDLVKSGGVKYNPYRRWAADPKNEKFVDKFNVSLIESLRFVIGEELGVETAKVKGIVVK